MIGRILDGLPWPRKNLLPLVGIMVLVGLVEYTRAGIYTAYLPQKMGGLLGLGAVGLAATVQYLADTLSRSPGGHLSERFGINRVLPLSALLAAVSALGIIFAPSAKWLFLASFANGLFVAPLWPTLLSYTSHAANSSEDGRAIGVTFTFIAPFIGLGVLLTGFLYDHSPELAAASLALIQLLMVVWALAFVRRIAFAAETQGDFSLSRFPWKKIAFLAPGALAQMFALGLLTPVIFPYLKGLGFSTSQLVIALLVGGGLEFALISPVGKLVDKHHPGIGFVTALFMAPLALLGFALMNSFTAFLLVAAYAGLVQALLIPSWGAFVSHSLPAEFRTSSWGALMTLEGLGFAIGPVIGGYSWQYLGSRAPFFIGAALYAAAAVFYFLKLRQKP